MLISELGKRVICYLLITLNFFLVMTIMEKFRNKLATDETMQKTFLNAKILQN